MLMADILDGQHPAMKFRLSIALAGLRERAHSSALAGDSASPADIVKVGSLAVLCAWTAFVFAGASFSKLSEHFSETLPLQSRALPIATYHLTAVVGILSGILVATGASMTLPSLARFLRNDGWTLIKRSVFHATIPTLIMLAGLLPIGIWAKQLTQYQRNGGDGLYSLTFVTWALLLALAMAAWTRAVVAVARRMELSPQIIHLEGLIAQSLAVMIAVSTTAIGIWWISMGMYAPRFFHGGSPVTPSSAFDPNLIIVMTLMLAAVVVSGYGVIRIRHACMQPLNT